MKYRLLRSNAGRPLTPTLCIKQHMPCYLFHTYATLRPWLRQARCRPRRTPSAPTYKCRLPRVSSARTMQRSMVASPHRRPRRLALIDDQSMSSSDSSSLASTYSLVRGSPCIALLAKAAKRCARHSRLPANQKTRSSVQRQLTPAFRCQATHGLY